MANIDSEIRAALEVHLASISGIPDIAYENVPFDPTTGTSFIKVGYIPTLRRPAVRGLNQSQRYQGIFAVTVYAAEGNGPATADSIATTIIEAFEATTDISFTNLSAQTFVVSIDYAERQQGIVDSPFYQVPINIGWYIYN